jgi:hypothetical protein
VEPKILANKIHRVTIGHQHGVFLWLFSSSIRTKESTKVDGVLVEIRPLFEHWKQIQISDQLLDQRIKQMIVLDGFL